MRVAPLYLALAACNPTTPAHQPTATSIRDLPVMIAGKNCDGEVRGSQERYVCRSIPVADVARILDYQKLLSQQGWSAVEPGFGRGLPNPGFSEHPETTQWYERPLSASCSQVLSFNVVQRKFGPDDPDTEIVVFLNDQREAVCGDERQSRR